MNFSELILVVSPFVDPYVNLAIENQLLTEVSEGQKYLLFYTNKPSVVMGRFQNPWVECKVGKMQADDITIVRRQSGGGCVYHDHGNLNFSFIQSTRDHLKDQNNTIIIQALNNLGLKAFASGRSDLMISRNEQSFKFSGSAFKQKKDRSIHHGTLLIESDLTKLNDYLFANDKKIDAKGIKSVRSKVVNLKELNENISKDVLIDEISKCFCEFYNVTELKKQSVENFINLDAVNDYIIYLKDWAWLFGETPSFHLKVDHELFSCDLNIYKGLIKRCEFNEHSVHPSLVDSVEKKMLGLRFTIDAIEELFKQQIKEFSMYQKELLEVLNVLKNEIEI